MTTVGTQGNIIQQTMPKNDVLHIHMILSDYHVPREGTPGVNGSPSLRSSDPLWTPPGGRLGPFGYTPTPGEA